MVREYYADSIDGEFVKKGMDILRFGNNPPSFIAMFDRKGNVTDVFNLKCEDEYVRLKSFDYYADFIHESSYTYLGLTREIINRLDDQRNVIETIICHSPNDSIIKHQALKYNEKGHLVKKLKFDHNMGIVALSEVVAYDSLNQIYKEIVIDCSPYPIYINSDGTPDQDEIRYRNILATKFRRYYSNNQLEFYYGEELNVRRIFNENGKLLTNTILEDDLESIRSKTEYFYYENELLKEEVYTKNGEVKYRNFYNYEFNSKGDWKVMKKYGKKNRIVEREFIYYE